MNLNDIPFIDLKTHTRNLQTEINEAISKVCVSASFSGGRPVDRFEEEFATFLGAPFFAGVSSGSDALMLALLALGIKPGDEVIVPANTYIATAFSVIRTGAIPVFADCDAVSWQMDPESVARMITKKTRAIIGVHMYGQAFPVNEIADLSKANGLYLLEDCAQSHGTLYYGKTVGTLSDAGCFSFYPTKNLGACGQAGGIAFTDKERDQYVRILREQGSVGKYQHDVVGYNMRMDSIQAAILSVKLPHLQSWNARRAEIMARYHNEIHSSSLVFQHTFSYTQPAWYLAVACTADRDKLMAALDEKHIHCGIHYPVPCHMQKSMAYLGYCIGDFPNAEYLAKHCVSLPLYPELTDSEVNRVIDTCNKYE